MIQTIYEAYAYRLQMVRDKQIKFGKSPVLEERAGAKIVRNTINEFGQTDRENLVVVMLNTKNHVIGINLVSIGTLNAAYASAREVFKAAIKATCCDAVILGHNHPSGECEPSPVDVAVTKKLVVAAHILGFTFYDHIIVDVESAKYFSFAAAGQITRMQSAARELIRTL